MKKKKIPTHNVSFDIDAKIFSGGRGWKITAVNSYFVEIHNQVIKLYSLPGKSRKC